MPTPDRPGKSLGKSPSSGLWKTPDGAPGRGEASPADPDGHREEEGADRQPQLAPLGQSPTEAQCLQALCSRYGWTRLGPDQLLRIGGRPGGAGLVVVRRKVTEADVLGGWAS